MHERIHAAIVGGGGQNQLTVAESVTDSRGHIIPGQVIDNYPGRLLVPELLGQGKGCLPGMAIYGSIGNNNSLLFRCIGRPLIIEGQIIAKILPENRSVQRTDHLNIQRAGNLQ